MESILIIEDDPSIALGLEKNLKFEGYNLLIANNGELGLELALNKTPDLVILDIMLPTISGFDICRQIRSKRLPVFILMLTARDRESDKITGLELGADDYLTKPFSIGELIARVRALLRRREHIEQPKESYTFGDFIVDFNGRTVTKDNHFLDMSLKEFEMLRLFIANEGKVLTRDEILNQVWGIDYFGTTRTVDNFITKLRHKLRIEEKKMEYIVTVRGMGYKFISAGEISLN